VSAEYVLIMQQGKITPRRRLKRLVTSATEQLATLQSLIKEMDDLVVTHRQLLTNRVPTMRWHGTLIPPHGNVPLEQLDEAGNVLATFAQTSIAEKQFGVPIEWYARHRRPVPTRDGTYLRFRRLGDPETDPVPYSNMAHSRKKRSVEELGPMGNVIARYPSVTNAIRSTGFSSVLTQCQMTDDQFKRNPRRFRYAQEAIKCP
jgi:hypothetical protein